MINGVEQAAELIRDSGRAVAFTGAGISKSAGIPTFRDLDDGLWLDRENLEWAHRQSFDADSEQWYMKFWEFYDRRLAAAPTAAHVALKDMVEAALLDTVVTQNIDGLDLLAGTDVSRVTEVHGNDRQLSCTDVRGCGFFIPTEDWLLGNERGGVPTCLRDDRPLKPDVMLFDDDLVPTDVEHNFYRGQQKIDEADALLVIGTTLEIPAWYSAVSDFSRQKGEDRVVVINPNTSLADQFGRFVIQATSDQAIPAIRDQLLT
ncbi:MAG TPA: Sir2 family NAD-dependent protein deacetylase [Candidatus Dormibacteraeota bacterium]|nr:Sir2 family NAD-dependent protein deacetylase [Candidatus Dormibacteraeota bacterium]